MVNVECPGCSAPYSVSEKRIPPGGLKMRCPKCGESFQVEVPAGSAAAPPRAAQAPRQPLPRRPAATLVGGHSPSGQGLAPVGRKKPIFAAGQAAEEPERVDFGGMPADLGAEGLLRGSKRRTPHAGGGALPGLEDGLDVDDGFGVLDVDLPGPEAEDGGWEYKDLPTPRGAPHEPMPGEEADLPMLAGEADLPMPVHGDDLPTYAGEADLPVARGQASRPVPKARALVPPARAERPVPTPHADLPVPKPRADLPVPKPHADLPVPKRRGGKPAPGGFDDLPVPAHGDDLPLYAGDADLPLPADGLDLPLPAFGGDLPLVGDHDLPLPTPGGDLPLPADQDLPQISATGDLPLPQDFNLPTAIGTSADDAIPMDDDFGLGDDLPPVRPPTAGEDGSYGETDDDPFGADLASHPPRPVAPPARDGGHVGDEFAVDEVDDGGADLLAGDALVDQLGVEPGQAPKIKIKKKRSKSLRVVIAVVPLLAIGGGLLSLTPLGPYGYYAISDALNRDSYAGALGSFRQAAQEQLDADTSAVATDLVIRARSEQSAMPRHAPMRAYAAYLAFLTRVRFGGGPESEGMATGLQLITQLPADASGDLVDLARAAQAAAEGKLNASQTLLFPLLERMGDDIDVTVLAGEVSLGIESYKEAEVLWKKAVELRSSARTLYGLARAEMGQNQIDGARKHADEVLKLSKDHAGARTLLATLLWRENKKSPAALEMLEEVTKDGGAVRAAASTSELVTAYSLLGDICLSQSKMTAAEKAFSAALKIDPRSERALIGNGELFYAAGRYSEALARFEAAHRVNAAGVAAAVGKAKTKIALERPKDAKDELTQLAKTSKHPLVGYWLGQAHMALGDRESAEKAYRAAIAAGGDQIDVVRPFVALADVLDARGETEEAARVLTEASERLPKNVELHNAKGDVALRAGRYEDAKREFSAALALEPDNSGSRFRLAIAHRRAREHDQAMSLLDKVASDDPEYPGLALEKGLVYEGMGQLPKALKMYQDALAKAPEDIDLKLRVGSTLVISGAPKEAVKLLRDVLSKRPQSAEVNHFLGRALLVLGEPPQEALRMLQAAVQYDPNRAEYHLYVAWAANEAGQPGVAETAIESALEIDKNLGDAYWQRGVLMQKRGQTLDALEELAIALQKNPSRSEAYATMALCYMDQSKYGDARDAWQKAIDGNGSMPEWHFRLAKILMDEGNEQAAATHLLRAVEILAERKQTPGWLWNAQFLLGEALRATDPKRALQAYKEFKRLAGSDNAYFLDAERAIEELEKRP